MLWSEGSQREWSGGIRRIFFSETLRKEILKEMKKNCTNAARFKTSQILADKTRMILKKAWVSEHEILEIYQEVIRKEHQPYPITRTDLLNTEKQEHPNKI